EDAARGLPGGDGAGGAVERIAGADRTALPEDGPAWPATVPAGDDAADPLPAAVVRAERPGHGRGAVRDVGDAPLCPPERAGQQPGRDHDPQLPPAAGDA